MTIDVSDYCWLIIGVLTFLWFTVLGVVGLVFVWRLRNACR